jgi:hypothetical protein
MPSIGVCTSTKSEGRSKLHGFRSAVESPEAAPAEAQTTKAVTTAHRIASEPTLDWIIRSIIGGSRRELRATRNCFPRRAIQYTDSMNGSRYSVTTVNGAMEADYPVTRFSELLDELSNADGEHPDIAIQHESEWSISITKAGFVILEHMEAGNPMHMGPLDRTSTLELMVAIAEGRIGNVRSKSWMPGYPRTGG